MLNMFELDNMSKRQLYWKHTRNNNTRMFQSYIHVHQVFIAIFNGKHGIIQIYYLFWNIFTKTLIKMENWKKFLFKLTFQYTGKKPLPFRGLGGQQIYHKVFKEIFD